MRRRDLDRDEIKLEAASQLLDEIERRQIVLAQWTPLLASCAGRSVWGRVSGPFRLAELKLAAV